MKFGHKIKTMLGIRGMTQEELSRKTKISLSLIKALANDRRQVTSTENLEKIAEVLGIDVAYFYDSKRVTPFEVIEEMPPHIRDFILKQEKMDWLELVHDLDEKTMDPEGVKKIIELYESIMKMEK